VLEVAVAVARKLAPTLIEREPFAEIAALRADVPRLGLKAPFRGRTVRDLSRDVLAIARRGLVARKRLNRMGDRDESRFLDVLDAIVDSGLSPAERKLAKFNTEWNHSVDPLFSEYAY